MSHRPASCSRRLSNTRAPRYAWPGRRVTPWRLVRSWSPRRGAVGHRDAGRGRLRADGQAERARRAAHAGRSWRSRSPRTRARRIGSRALEMGFKLAPAETGGASRTRRRGRSPRYARHSAIARTPLPNNARAAPAPLVGRCPSPGTGLRGTHEMKRSASKTTVLTRTVAIAAALLALAVAVPTLLAQSPQGVISGPVGPSPYDVVRGWHKPFAEPGLRVRRQLRRVRGIAEPHLRRAARRGQLPDPVPPGVRRVCRLDRDQRAQRHRSPRLAELSLHPRRRRQRQGAVDAVGSPVRGLGRTGTASPAHQPVRSRASRVGHQRDVQSDLCLLQRRQQAAEDAGREERPGQRRHALRASRRTWRFCRTAGFSSRTAWTITA